MVTRRFVVSTGIGAFTFVYERLRIPRRAGIYRYTTVVDRPKGCAITHFAKREKSW